MPITCALPHPLRLFACGLMLTSSLTLAPKGFAREHHCEHGMHHGHGEMTDEHQRERRAQRLSDLHDSLKLNADQASAWSEFEAAMMPTDNAPTPDFAAIDELPAPERMARKLDRMKVHQAWMESRIPMVTTFYAKLTPDQQKVFDREFMHPRGRHHAAPK